ncbi:MULTISPECIES: ribosomal protein S18-alanine N-acetyltransferase [Cycloclasticus]|jgi:ribosomal-protein-alanine N-acetyltransferase|uniref:ribosomal protein S18-alanine N-acetyltransferase n=1 Tax=Cycloclasticus TaxID=34067 RepID=UPI00040790C5|nr:MULTISPECIES: ribosomal protein S18-alanine N-acetyltransferase [Cycloclasticus]MBV1899326.1 ribosomal protein S18-alanine N-acetyltransferase [Cycloclasticus sp.]MDF1829474.1 ribosomal protein S18-alanine N-acetyltransferase [Cycloclasticus pugetii]
MLTKLKSLLSLTGPQVDYLRPLKTHDIPKVLTIERQMYSYPWSEGIFKDCLKIGYSNWAFIKDGQFVGYVILSVAVGEAHILNICLDPAYQGKGLGRQFLKEVLIIAKKKNANSVFLEVRPSNTAAVQLYKTAGFKKIGKRKNYYPAADGKEDALVLSLDLTSDSA